MYITYPSWDYQIINAYQIFFQFMQFLEVLHLYHIAMELSHHFRNLSQSSWVNKKKSLKSSH